MAFISWHFVLVKRSITSDCGANERYINTENVVIISVSKSITFNLMTLSVCGEVWYWISRLINEQLVSMLGWGVCASIKTSIYLINILAGLVNGRCNHYKSFELFYQLIEARWNIAKVNGENKYQSHKRSLFNSASTSHLLIGASLNN